MKEFEIVIATRDLEGGLVKAGQEGAIVDIHTDPEGYEVDFEVGDGWEVVTCCPADIVPKYGQLRKTA